MRVRLFALFLLCMALMSVPRQGQAQQTHSAPLQIGEIHTLHSHALQEDRILNIYLPPEYSKTKAYPVMYVLDGSMNEDFLHTIGLLQFFNMTFQMPECIVVGIANVDRRRDFTFHANQPDLKKAYPTTGHSDRFIRFIEEELEPFIDKQYKTTATRHLIGQSLGGLLATEILLKRPQLFSHYLITSPSLWWDDESLLKAAPGLLKPAQLAGRYVYICVGGNEEPAMIKDAADFVALLQAVKAPGYCVDYAPLPKEDHATILHQSLYQAFLLLLAHK